MTPKHNRISSVPATRPDPVMDARATQFLVGMAMVTGGIAWAIPSGGLSLLGAAKGIDEMQAALVGKDTVVYNGARAAGLPPAAARTVDILAAAPEAPIQAVRGIVKVVPALARGEMVLSGGELAGKAAVGAANGAAETPEHVAAAGATAGAELEAAGARGAAAPKKGPTSDDIIAEGMGPGHIESHGDPSSWKYLGRKTEPATEIGREAGSIKVYEVFLDENGKQVEWHYWVNPQWYS